jgi:anti-sigma regulatory factor (Ser/Thr protein kinase)
MSMQPRDVGDGDPEQQGLTCDLDTTSIRRVRQLVRELLDGHPGVLRDDAVLVADELVSNAIQHGQGPRSCRLALIDDGRGLLVEVTDSGPGAPAVRTPDATGGRGLLLVDRLTNAWGVRWFGGRKTVWAEMVSDSQERRRRAPHLAIAPEWTDPA